MTERNAEKTSMGQAQKSAVIIAGRRPASCAVIVMTHLADCPVPASPRALTGCPSRYLLTSADSSCADR